MLVMRVVRLRQPAVILLWLGLAVSGGAKLASKLCSTPYVYSVLSVQSGHGTRPNLASHVLPPLHNEAFHFEALLSYREFWPCQEASQWPV